MNSEDLGLELISTPAKTRQASAPLLFIHGGFHGAWCWADHFMPWFAERGFDCHAVSLRDHGRSARTGRHADWRLADYVNDARWAVDKIGEKPIVVGHSLGGSIAQKLIETDHFRGMILLAPSPIGGSNRAALKMMCAHPRAMIRAALKKDMAQALPAFLSFFVSDDLPETKRADLIKRLNGLTSFGAAKDAFYTDPPRPMKTDLPVLVVTGEKDWSIPHYKNEKLARAYGGDHIVVPTAHDIMCDTLWEEAAEALLIWLHEQGLTEN